MRNAVEWSIDQRSNSESYCIIQMNEEAKRRSALERLRLGGAMIRRLAR